jgi:acetyltransferase-like isoleucine patch superfamily enzyme
MTDPRFVPDGRSNRERMLVQIGPNVQLLTATHPVDPEPRRAKWKSAKPITIGSNA